MDGIICIAGISAIAFRICPVFLISLKAVLRLCRLPSGKPPAFRFSLRKVRGFASAA